jgi:hypothetical protein
MTVANRSPPNDHGGVVAGGANRQPTMECDRQASPKSSLVTKQIKELEILKLVSQNHIIDQVLDELGCLDWRQRKCARMRVGVPRA